MPIGHSPKANRKLEFGNKPQSSTKGNLLIDFDEEERSHSEGQTPVTRSRIENFSEK